MEQIRWSFTEAFLVLIGKMGGVSEYFVLNGLSWWYLKIYSFSSCIGEVGRFLCMNRMNHLIFSKMGGILGGV